MLLIWRGWGLMAVVAVFLPLACCAGLIETRQPLAFLTGGVTLLGGGTACWVCGRKWNRSVTNHTFYFIPLQYWGLAYMLHGVFFMLGGIVALFKKAG
jgi:hypothetical protein